MLSTELRQRLQEHGQEHLFAEIERLGDAERANLIRELERVNLPELRDLYARREQKDALPERERIQPLPEPVITDEQCDVFEEAGIKALAEGAVAYLIVAGGQGTRLGFDQPKGMFPIGPLSKKSLFQLHA
jgi:UDP-N-acetylglucosamine/UDP-N-acetylgalactosamine diphosphorylase